MCHHSLPSIIAPVSDKRGVHSSLLGVCFVCIYIAYLGLGFSMDKGFGGIQPVSAAAGA